MRILTKIMYLAAMATLTVSCGSNKYDKIIALSFDDGPSNITQDVLDILKKEKVKASFFVVGSWATTDDHDYSELTTKAYKAGHAIGNHTWTHPYMTRLTAEQMTEEIEKCTEYIVKMTGEKPAFFRPPYINVNKLLHETVDLTFINGINCEDWDQKVDAATRTQKILDQAKDGDIILMHDMADNVQTVEALKTLIPALKERGFELVTIPELFKRKGVTPEPHNGIVYSNALQTK